MKLFILAAALFVAASVPASAGGIIYKDGKPYERCDSDGIVDGPDGTFCTDANGNRVEGVKLPQGVDYKTAHPTTSWSEKGFTSSQLLQDFPMLENSADEADAGYCRAMNGDRVLCSDYPCMFTTDVLTDQKACFLLAVEKVAGLAEVNNLNSISTNVRTMGQAYVLKSNLALFMTILEATAERDENLIAGTRILMEQLDNLQVFLAERRKTNETKL